jgi:hypothetical protein
MKMMMMSASRFQAKQSLRDHANLYTTDKAYILPHIFMHNNGLLSVSMHTK